ncbi:MAG TPA: SAM-dependent methyltransferase [Nitrospira sp.]|nr:SAM-dependent methyltransferase [Nitrospira sp.]
MTPHVVIVGLGPGGADLVTAGTLDALSTAPAVIARTERHPAVTVLPAATAFCDDLYEHADTMEEVYTSIVERVVGDAEQRGSAVYAVPGSPVVAERTVQLLLADPRGGEAGCCEQGPPRSACVRAPAGACRWPECGPHRHGQCLHHLPARFIFQLPP